MNLSGIVQSLAARWYPDFSFGPSVPPREGGEIVETESAEVQKIRECIAGTFAARAAHGLVVGQRDEEMGKLNVLMTAREAAQGRLTAREKQIALTDVEMPDAPFPEETEVARLNRHARIQQERIKNAESRVRESQAVIEGCLQKMEESWVALGAALSGQLLKHFREAAAAVRDAQFSYFSVYSHFCKEWNGVCWKHETRKLAISDPMTYELILHPLHLAVPAQWPLAAQTLLKDVEELRAEIDAVKSK